MNGCNYNPYVLPTIDFVAGETQDLAFHTFYYNGRKPFSLMGCTCNFSIVSFMNKTGAPLVSKPMKTSKNADGSLDNVLTVTLTSADTIDLFGKYVYQITIKDIGGDVEIPKQGIMYITNNIDKGFTR